MAPKRNGSKAAVGRKLPISDAGQSALHCAAQNGHADVVSVLLSTENVDVTLADSCGRSALHCAAQNGHADVVQCLLKDRRFGTRMVNKVDSSGDSALLLAICGKHTDVVDILLQNRHVDHLRPNSRQVTVTNHTGEKQRWPAGLTPLHLAAVMGHAAIVSAFARHGRISAESFVVFPGSPLDAAVVGNNPQCVRIVKEFVPMNRRGFEGNTCLHMAAQCSSVEIIECLLDLGADPRIQDDHKNTALGIVVSFRKFQSDRLQIAQQLVAAARSMAGPPLFNIPDSGSHTPVLLAATFGDAKMLQFMIDQPESDVTARNNAGSTALHRATEEHVRRKRAQAGGDAAALADAAPPQQLEDWLQCVRLLLAHPRADVAAVDDAGDTVLHIAAAADAVDVCREVVAVDASVVDMADRQGRSALMVAIARQAAAAAEFLISEANADLEHVDQKGWAPLHFAASVGDLTVLRALLAANPALNVNRQDNRQLTAAHTAVHKGHLGVLRALLDLPQFDVLAGRDGLSLAHCACSSSAAESADMLALLLGAQDKRLQERVFLPQAEWTHRLEDDGVCRFQTGAPLLHTAARAAQPQSMDVATLKQLLKAVVEGDPLRRLDIREAAGSTALHLAARHRHWRVGTALLDTALWGAAALRDLVTAQDPQGQSTLHVCAEVDEHTIAEAVLALGYDGVCNQHNERRETPLVTAARCGSESVIAALLRYGGPGSGGSGDRGRVEVVDVLAPDSRGRTALHWAAELGHGAGVLGSLLGTLPKAPDQPAGTLCAATLFEVKDALWHARDGQGRLALHLAAQRGHWGSVELLLSRHEPDLRTIGHDGRRLVDMLRDTPAADTACVRQVIADEAYNELLAEASKAQATSKKREKRKARKKKAQKALAAEEAAGSSDEEQAVATPPASRGREAARAAAAGLQAAHSRGGAAEGSRAGLDAEAATAAAVAAIAQSGSAAAAHDSPLMAMLGALEGPAEEEWQQVRVRSQKHAHSTAPRVREGSSRSDSARAPAAGPAHGAASDSHRGGRRGRPAARSRPHGADAAGAAEAGAEGGRHFGDASAAAVGRSSPAHAPRVQPRPAAAPAAAAVAPEWDRGGVAVHAWGGDDWPELPGPPGAAASGLSEQTAAGAGAGPSLGMDSAQSARPASIPALALHAGMPHELSPPFSVTEGDGAAQAPVMTALGGDEDGSLPRAPLPDSGTGLAALPGWSSFGLAGLDSMPLGSPSIARPSIPRLATQPAWQPGAVGDPAWAPLQQPSLTWPQAPLSGGHHAEAGGSVLGDVVDLHMPAAKSLGARVSEALNAGRSGMPGEGDLQPDFESIVRQAGVDDDDDAAPAGTGVPLRETNEAGRLPEWAAADLQHTALGSLASGRFSMF
eukprot:jgi/Ulvmu1/5268/UM022_0062.1